ncbi:hypothetical protein HD554DRAFT_312109 [Boletus coccyginus]|nr:hypothetical protein HD554DRAFT_312109 [Boletus coccyginus]
MSLTWTRSHHGVAAVFEKLLPLAHAHNLRIVSVYRRGYPPSSGFHNDELAGIGLDAGPFLRAQGAEIATFLVNFAMVQGIPLADPDPNDPNVSGIVLIGWSLGGAHVLALLACLDELQADTQLTLRKYVISRGVPRHDTSLWSETDDRKLFDAFFDWVTAHYTHKSVTSEDLDDLEFNHPSDIPHSFNDLSYSQRAEYTCPDAVSYAGCDRKLLFCGITTFAAITKCALFDEARAEKFPNVRVRYMSDGTSSGALTWPLWMLRKYAENPPAELYGSDAEKARDIRFITQTLSFGKIRSRLFGNIVLRSLCKRYAWTCTDSVDFV